jgi:SAM-dependent methyltransferase
MIDPKPFWRDRRVLNFYKQDQPYRTPIAEKVLAEKPSTVLEFGCNVGRNLIAIRTLDKSVRLKGVDVAPAAVRYGRLHWNLDLTEADEAWLAKQPDDAFDVAFTVSVLDHIPDPDPVMVQLARIAPVLLLCEPWMGREGDVVEEGYKPNSATWSWDIPARLRAMGMKVTTRKFPLSDDGFGGGLAGIYRLYRVTR